MRQQQMHSGSSEAEVLATPVERLVPMLLENLLSRLVRASAQMESGDMAGKAASLGGAAHLVQALGTLGPPPGDQDVSVGLQAACGFFGGEIRALEQSWDAARISRLVTTIRGVYEMTIDSDEAARPTGRSGAVRSSPPLA
jgi:flagellin-specific chaperone FliS